MSKVNDVGIPGLKPPESSCNDEKCPWHGRVRVRGRLLRGSIVKAKMHRTVVVRHDYIYYVKKYRRFERRHSHIHAHNPPCISAAEGDEVLIGETRPLAKTVSFVVLQVLKKRGER